MAAGGPSVASLISKHGDEARRRAEAYAHFYTGRRGSMVPLVHRDRRRPCAMSLPFRWKGRDIGLSLIEMGGYWGVAVILGLEVEYMPRPECQVLNELLPGFSWVVARPAVLSSNAIL